MTPEGRQDLAAVIAEMRAQASMFATLRVDNTLWYWPLGEKLKRWADRLALLLAEARGEDVSERNQAHPRT